MMSILASTIVCVPAVVAFGSIVRREARLDRAAIEAGSCRACGGHIETDGSECISCWNQHPLNFGTIEAAHQSAHPTFRLVSTTTDLPIISAAPVAIAA